LFADFEQLPPWTIVQNLQTHISKLFETLQNDYFISNGIAIHKTATVEQGAILKGTIIVSANCFIASHAYLRGPIYLDNSVIIGPSSEIKQSIIGSNSAAAHFNFIGDSIIGSNVNFEAGAVIANHLNEKKIKEIFVTDNQKIINTNCQKFGALVGDNCKIGANAVLSPGTILQKNTIINRLQLVKQIADE
jgi:bifunctional N-acetylglucosamine-1-phosphate-uridyltransferase/glucosamine-1-phosphate-acetyltransferase GlmU-like protein